MAQARDRFRLTTTERDKFRELSRLRAELEAMNKQIEHFDERTSEMDELVRGNRELLKEYEELVTRFLRPTPRSRGRRPEYSFRDH